MKASQPIGVFDSGVGGLTVASALKKVLPNEHMIYFGDTFHLPYGDKSKESVEYYSKNIADFLIENNCKAIVIACNTASANAFEAVKKHVDNKAIVFNVIDPVVENVTQYHNYQKIGVVGTKGTINSNTYAQRIQSIKNTIEVKSMATPLFVPMIEEGFIFDDISNAIVRSYLSKEEIDGIEALILGCTHYPIIKNQISKYYDFNVEVFDSASIVANYVRQVLQEKNLINTTNKAEYRFYVSDYTDYFKKISKMFFEEKIALEKLNFWE